MEEMVSNSCPRCGGCGELYPITGLSGDGQWGMESGAWKDIQ